MVCVGRDVYNKEFFKRCREFSDGDPLRKHTKALNTDQLVVPSGRVCQNLESLPALRTEFLALATASDAADVNSIFGRRGFDTMVLLAASWHILTPLDPSNPSDRLVIQETLTRWRNGGGRTHEPVSPDLLYSCLCEEYLHYLQVYPPIPKPSSPFRTVFSRNPQHSTLDPKPCTLDPSPQSLNPDPQTRQPEPCSDSSPGSCSASTARAWQLRTKSSSRLQTWTTGGWFGPRSARRLVVVAPPLSLRAWIGAVQEHMIVCDDEVIALWVCSRTLGC